MKQATYGGWNELPTVQPSSNNKKKYDTRGAVRGMSVRRSSVHATEKLFFRTKKIFFLQRKKIFSAAEKIIFCCSIFQDLTKDFSSLANTLFYWPLEKVLFRAKKNGLNLPDEPTW